MARKNRKNRKATSRQQRRNTKAISVTGATFARVQAADPKRGGPRRVVEAALADDPDFAAYEMPELGGEA